MTDRRWFLLACSAAFVGAAGAAATTQGVAGSRLGGPAAPPSALDDLVAANRVLAMEDVLGAAMYLISDLAHGTTGAALAVDDAQETF